LIGVVVNISRGDYLGAAMEGFFLLVDVGSVGYAGLAAKVAGKALFKVAASSAKVVGRYASKAGVALARQAVAAIKIGKNVVVRVSRVPGKIVCWVTDNCFVEGTPVILDEDFETWLAVASTDPTVQMLADRRLNSFLVLSVALAARAKIAAERRRRRKALDDTFQEWDDADPCFDLESLAGRCDAAAASEIWDKALSDEEEGFDGLDNDDVEEFCFLSLSHER
jgi:hypothetical protein